MKISPRLLSTLSVLALVGCGSPVGEQCHLTSGALGFGFSDPCKTKCLELSNITCPDGSVARKAVCAGDEGCSPDSCDDGQACYSFQDPVEKYFYCIPEDFCGTTLTQMERLAWETESRERSDAVRAEFAERMMRRTNQPTAPGVQGE